MKIISATATARFLTICCIGLLHAFTPAYSDDLKLEDGRILKNFKIINHSPKDAMVVHDDGADTVLLKDFPEELRKKYGYEEEKVEAYEAEQAKAQEKYKEHQEQRRIENQKRQAEFEEKLAEKKRLEELWSRSRYAEFTIISVTEDGLLATEKIEFKETRRGADGKLGTYRTTKDSDEIYFIIDAPVINAVDGKEFDGYFARIGTYTYTTVSGSNATAAKLIWLPHVKNRGSKARLAPDPKEQKELLREQKRRAAELEEQLTDETNLRHLRRNAFPSTFTVLSITEDGILARGKTHEVWELQDSNGRKVRMHSVFPKIELVFIDNYPSDGVIDGQKLDGFFAPIGRHTYTAVSGARKTVLKLFYFRE